MKYQKSKKSATSFLLCIISSFLLFALTLFIIITGFKSIGRSVVRESERATEEAIRRAAVSCYALEGSYPENYNYLEDNYNLSINEKLYEVQYRVFASNIMPEITVIRRQN